MGLTQVLVKEVWNNIFKPSITNWNKLAIGDHSRFRKNGQSDIKIKIFLNII